jgi:hypothetical protein
VVRDLDRAVEDQAVLVFELKAEHDFADRKGNILFCDFRHGVNARSRDAIEQPPATRIFPDDVEYYTAAPISEQAERYAELEGRVTAHLPEDEALRAPILVGLSDALTAYGVLRSEPQAQRAAPRPARGTRRSHPHARAHLGRPGGRARQGRDGFFPATDAGDDEKDEGEGTATPA